MAEQQRKAPWPCQQRQRKKTRRYRKEARGAELAQSNQAKRKFASKKGEETGGQKAPRRNHGKVIGAEKAGNAIAIYSLAAQDKFTEAGGRCWKEPLNLIDAHVHQRCPCKLIRAGTNIKTWNSFGQPGSATKRTWCDGWRVPSKEGVLEKKYGKRHWANCLTGFTFGA